MNFDNRDKDDINFDDMDIRSHLNTSLDVRGISVSEKLIQKTLQAIKDQPEMNQDLQDETSKEGRKAPWGRYVRGFAGVAAAALVLLAGYQGLASLSMDKGNSGAPKELIDLAREEATRAEVYYEAEKFQDDADVAEDSVEYKMSTTMESEAQFGVQSSEELKDEPDSIMKGSENHQGGMEIEPSAPSDNQVKITAKDDGLVQEGIDFSRICVLAPEEITSVKITETGNESSINLVSKEEIIDFYSLMEKTVYIPGGNPSSKIEYRIEIIGNDSTNSNYIINISDGMTVEVTSGDTVSYATYTIDRRDEFIREFSKFLAGYK